MRSVLALLLVGTLSAQAPPSFEVATIRPTAGPIPGVPPIFGQQRATDDTLLIRHTPLREIIRRGFDIVDQGLVGPDWLKQERFDVTAKAEKRSTEPELWAMIPQLLADRFQLKYHREPREVSGMALVIGKNGPKVMKSEGGTSSFSMGGGSFRGHNVPMSRLAQLLSSVTQRPVLDATGLEGTYDFSIDPRKYAGQGPPDLAGMAILAVQEELGLKLESRKFEMQVIIIDHIDAKQGDN